MSSRYGAVGSDEDEDEFNESDMAAKREELRVANRQKARIYFFLATNL